MNFVCSFPEIDDMLLDEYSALCAEWDTLKRPKNQPADLEKWGPSHLLGFLLEESTSSVIKNSNKLLIHYLFKNKIYGGKDLIKWLDENPSNIKLLALSHEKEAKLLFKYCQQIKKTHSWATTASSNAQKNGQFRPPIPVI